MKVSITINAECKVHLINELQNVLENIVRYDRFEPVRTFKHGDVKVEVDGEYAKFAVVDSNDDYVSFHSNRKEANEAAGEHNSVINLTKGW